MVELAELCGELDVHQPLKEAYFDGADLQTFYTPPWPCSIVSPTLFA